MITISELNIRFHGAGAEEGRYLAARVSDRLGQLLPDGGSDLTLNSVDLKVEMTSGMTNEELADLIAKNIARQLNVTLK